MSEGARDGGREGGRASVFVEQPLSSGSPAESGGRGYEVITGCCILAWQGEGSGSAQDVEVEMKPRGKQHPPSHIHTCQLLLLCLLKSASDNQQSIHSLLFSFLLYPFEALFMQMGHSTETSTFLFVHTCHWCY